MTQYTVSSGVTSSGVTLGGGGDVLYVLSGGVATGVVDNAGLTLISSGGLASDYTKTTGSGYIYAGGAISGATLSGGGLLMDYGTLVSAYTNDGFVLAIASGGVISASTLVDGQYDVYDGSIIDTTIGSSGGGLIIHNSGLASNITANTANITVLSGGEIDNLTASGGIILNSADGILSSVVIEGGAFFKNFGSATSVTADSVVNNYAGGVIDGITVTSTTYTASSGSITNNIKLNSGVNGDFTQAFIESGAVVTSGLVSGWAAIYDQGGNVSNITLSAGGGLYISSGGISVQTTVNSGGGLIVLTSGSAVDNFVEYGGTETVAGGSVSADTVEAGGTLNVAAGSAVGETILGTENLTGGTVTSNVISSGGVVNISGGSFDTTNTLLADATVNVYSGGTFDDFDITSAVTVNVSGGSVDSLAINAGGLENVYSGVSSDVTINSGGNVNVYGGTDTDVTIAKGGVETIYSGGAANYGEVLRGGVLNVSGGTAEGFILAHGGTEYVYSGLSVGTIAASGAQVIVSGGVDSATTLAAGASETVYGGGVASQTVVEGTATLTLSGGSAYAPTILTSGNLFVYSRGVAQNATINSAATETVFAGGVTSGSTIENGATLVLSGGKDSGTQLLSGGAEYVYSGSEASGTVINSGADIYVEAEGSASNLRVYGTENISSGGVDNGSIVEVGGVQNVSAGGYAPNGTVSGTENVHGTDSGSTIASGGVINVYSGGVIIGDTVSGTANVASGGVASATIVASGGVLSVASGGTLSGTTTLADGGSATIWNTAGGTIDLQGSTNVGLVVSGLENGGTLSTVITGFDGVASGNSDGIEIAGVKASDIVKDGVTYSDDDHVTLALTNGNTITLNIVGVKQYGYTLDTASDGDVLFEVCFLAGSMIRTVSGDVAVEEIRIGDQVSVFDWRANAEISREVTWVGSKKMVVRSGLPDDEAGYPVRVLKDAIADGVPYKDMLITPEHCLFFEDRFVPVRMLVNGRSIFYDRSLTHYTYYHVETEQHSVIWADGALTESYLDTGNRSTFRQAGSVVRLVPVQQENARDWASDGAAVLNVTCGSVEPLFRALEKRAELKGHVSHKPVVHLTEDADLHLVTDKGQVIRAARRQGQSMVFMLPVATETVRLVSRTSRPSDVIGPFVDDRRRLGVLVGQISLFDGMSTVDLTDHLDKADLSGWDVLENSACRWTNGDAGLPVDGAPRSGLRLLSLQILASGPYLVEQDMSVSGRQTLNG